MIFSDPMLKLLLALLAPLCWAQSPASLTGYVVKVEGATVYLEFGEPQGVRPGQTFTLFSEGEELKHPVTGASLGRVETPVGEGTVSQAHEKYSLGTLSAPLQTPAQGLRFRLVLTPAPQPAPAPAQTAPPAAAASAPAHPPLRKTPFFDVEAVDLAFGDVDGDGRPELLLAGKNTVDAYGLEDARPVCRFKDESSAARILSLDAGDLDGDGRSEAFAVVNNGLFGRVETYVLACSSGAFAKGKTLPWMVRRFADGKASALAAQQLNDDPTFPFGPLHRLGYEGGQYVLSKEKLSLPRVEWLYGFGVAQDGEGRYPFFLTFTNRIRFQFDKKRSWSTPDAYDQTSSRLRWREKLLQFNQRLLPKNAGDALAGLYTLRNVPRFGALSDAFGSYNTAELHWLQWSGMSLAPDWKTDLPGYASGLAEVPGRPEIAVSVVGANGKTSVWFFPR